jgi:ribonucleoside-triphosphate reductase
LLGEENFVLQDLNMTSATTSSNEGSVSRLYPPATVRKRDGLTLQPFDSSKLRRALVLAWESVGNVDERAISKVMTTVTTSLSVESDGHVVDVETVQDVVEMALMRHRAFAVAKAYILYRHQRSEDRQIRGNMVPDPRAISDYIHASKYARYLPDQGRREVYSETVARVEGMHISQHPSLERELREAFDLVREKKVLPSMRSMQFGGDAILVNNNRIYNCCFTLIDRLEAFSEAMFLLLSGCGVGYSVQFDHVENLPPIPYIDPKAIRHHVVEDSIEGWADAIKALIQSYQDKMYLEVSYHRIRPAGSPLKTSGGRAPGHLKLKESLERIRSVLDGAQGRSLRPVECHRIMCHAADAVLSGGIRRSAMICLFSLDDSEMMHLKTGNWYTTEPWLANANNSVVLKRDEVKKKQFKRIFQMIKQWGEPGFYFTNDYDYGTNPCCEIGLNPKLTVDAKIQARLAKQDVQVDIGDTRTGWAFCNLCEINAAKLTSLEDFLQVAKAATLIGTVQATYTKMPYLGWVSELLAEREALLGIGMTGMLDSPAIACNPEYQRKVASKIRTWNAEYAERLGIQPAARTTCVKPSGTTSLELGCVASGHHAHHARRYIRRVVADELELVFQAFRAINPHMCVRKPDGKWVIEFCVEAPAAAIVKNDLQAIEFLDMVRSTQQNWVLPGTAGEEISPGLTHNVSNTITVQPSEWAKVADYLWEYRDHFTGVSMISSSGDKDYAFAPNEAVTTAADEARWNTILSRYRPLDYLSIVEIEDGTNHTAEAACAGGMCSIV